MPPSENPPDNGAAIFTLNSDIPLFGFDFTTMDTIQVVDPNQPTYDFVVLTQIDINGAIVGPFLSSSDLINGNFQLQASYASFQDARSFYDTLSRAQDTSFTVNAVNLLINQVWVVKGSNGVDGKVLITQTRSDSSVLSPFSEISFLADSL